MNVLPLAGFALTVAWAYTRSMRRTDMKRLTYFDGGKWRLKIGDTEYSGEVADRLSAYEAVSYTHLAGM